MDPQQRQEIPEEEHAITPHPMEEKRVRPKWLLPVVIACIVVVLLAGGVLWSLTKSYDHEYWWAKLTHEQPIVFKIGNQTYTKSQVQQIDSYIMTAKKQSPDQAARTMFDLLKTEKAAQTLGLQPTQEETRVALSGLGFYNLNSNSMKFVLGIKYVELSALKAALPAAEKRLSQDGEYRGYVFEFGFGERIIGNIEDPSLNVSGFGDPKLIAADRSNAQKAVQQYHDLIQSGKLTPDQAVKQLTNASTRVSYSSAIQFGTDPSIGWQQQVYDLSIANFITKQDKTGVSAIQTGKTPLVAVPKSDKDYADTSFFFVVLTKAASPNGHIDAQFQQTFRSLKSKYYGE